MKSLNQIPANLIHLFFPKLCLGCGSDLVQSQQLVCLHCENHLRDFECSAHTGNEVEDFLRAPLNSVRSQRYYFVRDSLVQQLIHQLKYGGQEELGRWMGLQMAKALKNSGRFESVTALVPMPLFASRQRKRGYNQAAVLCEGISSYWTLPAQTTSVIRNRQSASQTAKQGGNAGIMWKAYSRWWIPDRWKISTSCWWMTSLQQEPQLRLAETCFAKYPAFN